MPRMVNIPTGNRDKNGKMIMKKITEADWNYLKWKKADDERKAREEAKAAKGQAVQ